MDEWLEQDNCAVSTNSGKPVVADPQEYRNRLLVRLANSSCRLCRLPGHWSIDCPKKPCFICRKEGHTATLCPYRTIPGEPLLSSKRLFSSPDSHILGHIRWRESTPTTYGRNKYPNLKTKQVSLQVGRAILRLHLRRVTALEFHPQQPEWVLSGDKRGILAIWNFENNQYHVNSMAHMYLIHGIVFDPNNGNRIFTASADGTLLGHDLKTFQFDTLLDSNPNGWEGPSTWSMLCSIAYNSYHHTTIAGDNFGNVYIIDDRIPQSASSIRILAHKKKTKVTGIDIHPREPNLISTCGNDRFLYLWDARMFTSNLQLAKFEHPRVVNAAFFSPVYGTKILSTCQDNRLRIWDNIQQDLKVSREIIHSHDFNRYLSPFKAVWDPKDWKEDLILCGRYIGEEYYDPKTESMIRLHPIDLYSACSGHIVAELVDLNIPTISPLNKFHPTLDKIISGTSYNLFLWEDKERAWKEQVNDGKSAVKGRKKSSLSSESPFEDEGDSSSNSDGYHPKRRHVAGLRRLEDESDNTEDEMEDNQKRAKSLAKTSSHFIAFHVPDHAQYKQQREQRKGPKELDD
ncbi:protein damaged DNA-binding 2 [Galdieria sulphuraria]|uniref:DNA damage-binding protein 2 n=1 Tax=Galdieria sulphuraria TaxID=130081 RepID=M2VVP4_GALSU|nr:DNA damage-binding protein 2 [Galdieria sulphuraria]EME27296.1 DNA damage-binding protein 2 [Galdieria sulphuraria]GJD11356.1 protein damaged DNA-binding 2 [Galdieria sulphuraria]|eukprot:XP_005703816.1 DNA damage-binding protein 2 [Galdieria sulphuraria]